MKAKNERSWIVGGGRRGELAHCQRCGVGLELGRPQTVRVTVKAMQGFEEDHANCKEGDNPNPEVITRDNWARSRDTGVSSWTIYSVMKGMNSTLDRYAPPQDPADFGRCYRLLKLFPEWESRLPEVAARFPEWSGLVRAWSNLSTIYESSLEGDRSKLYNAIQDLLKEGGAR